MSALLRAAIAASLLAGAVGASAAETPEIELSVDRAEVTVGDLFTATVTVTWPEGVQVTSPSADADLGDAEVRAAQESIEALPDGGQKLTLQYQATLWEVGESTVQAPPVTWQTAEGAARELERPEATVVVRSVLPAGAEDILPIRDPREIPLRAAHYLLAALPALLVLGLIAAGVIWARRRAAAGSSREAPAPPLGPADEALAALDALEAEDLVGQGMLKEHYVELSQVLRRYIERRWRLPALEETTGMLAESMRACGQIDQGTREAISSVLQRADLAKFARHCPEATVARADIDEVREIVRTTRPREEAQESEEQETALAS